MGTTLSEDNTSSVAETQTDCQLENYPVDAASTLTKTDRVRIAIAYIYGLERHIASQGGHDDRPA